MIKLIQALTAGISLPLERGSTFSRTDSYGVFDYPKQLGILIKVYKSEMHQRLGNACER